MSTVVADLHIHTSRSDGEVAPSSLPAIAAAAGLEAVAITDHDRLPPWPEPSRDIEGITVLSGIELRVDAGDIGRLDLLGFGVQPTEELAATVSELQDNRLERARRMIANLEHELELTLDIEITEGIGRPHLADAVSDVTELSTQAVFEHYIGDGGPCYVPRQIPSFETGRRLLSTACEAVVLAHPLRYDDPATALSLTAEFDGVEIHYPYSDTVGREVLTDYLEDDSLIYTGGSDAHTIDAIGRCGLDESEYAATASRLGVPMD